jgi:hypothetical protein
MSPLGRSKAVLNTVCSVPFFLSFKVSAEYFEHLKEEKREVKNEGLKKNQDFKIVIYITVNKSVRVFCKKERRGQCDIFLTGTSI